MPKCVLVVDDDQVVHVLAKGTLESKGYEIISARDGLEALEVLKTKIPDLILLDVQMPKMDGYAFIMKKTADPALAKIPVIVLTSMGKTEPLFKRHGVKAYLLKPIETKDLLEKIQAIIAV
jgi:CheY-like chemotaxis protein